MVFQWLSSNAFRGFKTRFVDVDFPELIAKKRDIIVDTPQLSELLGSYHIPEDCSGTYLRSQYYSAWGCDLTDTSKLDALLSNEINLSETLVLCTAEVSVTYMDVKSADTLIQWAARHDQSKP